MRTASHEQNDAVNLNVDVFMALSRLGLSNLERLTALNIEATRAALEDGVSAYSSMLHPGEKNARSNGQLTTGALDYLKKVQGIALETQQEVTELMTSYVSPQGNGGSASAAWAKGFDLFKSYGEQFANMTEANTKKAGNVTARIATAATAAAHSK